MKVLLEKIDELLINRLGYNPVIKKVFFSKDSVNQKGAEGEETHVHKMKISPYIHAKLTRLKYLRRRARTKDMTLVNMQTVEIDRTYVNMSYYWYQARRQLRIMVEQIDALTHYKEIIIKFDNIQTESELRGLLNDMNTETKEFIEKMKPYLKYIASHILLQPESKVRNVANAREFKILMDGSIFNLEFANTRFVLASLKDIPIEVLNNIQKNQQVDIKFLLRSNKLVDIQQFEKIFSNKINLDDILNDKKDDPKTSSGKKSKDSVSVSPFALAKYEVTQQQWQQVMGYNNSENKNCMDCPVENISWYEVDDFIRILNETSDTKFRLPTNAEWDYAVRLDIREYIDKRGGPKYGDNVAWNENNAQRKTHSVGTRIPHRSGTYDLMGNVAEWCADWYDLEYLKSNKNLVDPVGPPMGTKKVVRGGTYANKDFVELYSRDPKEKQKYIGFRLVQY
ncbi:MAG: hypothetical protein EOP48_12885 [Sphingobacteriales bacterium]|nr:MAG: hypothetical protein EOP48_12885 [Sphingobacteriales bacterium]